MESCSQQGYIEVTVYIFSVQQSLTELIPLSFIFIAPKERKFSAIQEHNK